MDNLKDQIAKKLKQIEQMIEVEENKNKIEEERKELDELLEKYLNDMWK